MDTSRILNELRSERDRINQAIAALEALTPSAPQTASQPKRRGRKPAAAKQGPGQPAPAKQVSAGKRTLSPSARKRISEAAKRRWAAQKAAAK